MENIAELSPEKLELLTLLLNEKSAGHSSFPLSFAQQRLWFLNQMDPGNISFNVPLGVHLSGSLDIGAMEESLNEIVRRHESLRTTFGTREGQPVQVIAAELKIGLRVTDLSQVAEREEQVLELAAAEARRPFDLEQGPLLRAQLLRLAADEHVVLLTMHHIVSDGWSMGVLVKEVAALYAAYSRGEGSPLEELPIQYADYAAWQREHLSGAGLEDQLAYWREQLRGAPAVLELPTDRPRPAIQSYRGAHHRLVLDRELSEGLKQLSQQQGVTLFMMLLAAFKILLYRYTGQTDVVVGSDVANRGRVEVEGLIGFFVNQLVLRTDLSGDPTFVGLLERVRATTLGAYAHQELPFEKVVDAVQAERDVSHTPLFQVKLVLQNAPMTTLKLAGLTLRELGVSNHTAKTDLTLFVTEDERLTLTAEYNTDLFEAGTIRRLVEHFHTVLAAIVENPEQAIDELELLDSAERGQVLQEWNETGVEYESRCLQEMFEKQVERTPAGVALRYEGEEVSYQELNERANQQAHELRRLGVGPEVLVGLMLERSIEMVVALLAVLKAGGAYVPLDPSYPRERLRFMLADAGLRVLVAEQGLLGLLGEVSDSVQVVALEELEAQGESHSKANLESGVTVDHLAYVIYTSGSTGQPKGVMNSHRGICNRLLWMQDEYQLTEDDRVLQKTPFSFDVSVWEFFWPLAVGACLVVARPGGHQDNSYLVELICKQKITTLHFVPSMLQVFLEEPRVESCTSLKRVICSGEVLPFELQEHFFRLLSAGLYNLFGPTEAAVDVTSWACEPESRGHFVPIGRPIANIQIYLLDNRMNPVPVGVPGELYIGGVGVARGYFNRPELTAEKFVVDPFRSEAGMRLYKTGDLASYLPDGNIKYLGRLDHQVKIRGFRIELGEIEAALEQHPDLQKTVVVMVREDVPGDKRLVAYAARAGAHVPTVTELRIYLKERLPEYMIPAAFVMLAALPLTPNGKLDRRALPAPDQSRPRLREAYVAPGTEAEKILAGIWSQVLNLKQVGLHDNFFELGGDSILSIQTTARANHAGLRLIPAQIFQHQTIAELAAVAGSAPALQADQGVVTGAVPLTPIQHWFFEQNQPHANHFNQAIMLEVRQPFVASLLEKTLAHLLGHHDALRLRFEHDASGWRQFNADVSDHVPFAEVDLSTVPEAEQKGALESAASELQASLNLTSGPLLRVVLFHLGVPRKSRLLIIVHHLAVDGVSWRILLEDLETIYRQLSRSEKPDLPPKTTSYKHWADRLLQHASSEALQKESAYWLNAARQNHHPLPLDFAQGENTIASARAVSNHLTTDETQALLEDVSTAYRSEINDVLLAALAQAFAEWTGQSSLLVDLEGHGREEIDEDVDVTRTVGWFTTMVPVRLDLSEAQDPGVALKITKEQLRAIPRRGIGYGVLRYLSEEMSIVRELRPLDRSEVAFNYLGQLDRVLPQNSLFGSAPESVGLTRSGQQMRNVLLEVNGRVAGGRLHFDWWYSENIHRRSTIEKLAGNFLQSLRSLISHCLLPEAGGYTPSDFPQMQFSQKELDELAAELSGPMGGNR